MLPYILGSLSLRDSLIGWELRFMKWKSLIRIFKDHEIQPFQDRGVDTPLRESWSRWRVSLNMHGKVMI
jgi:hypothetical protein